MQVTNLAYFYETAKNVRGGKFVWVKDSNGEQRGNVLLGGTIMNPNKGFGHLWAAQLVQYTPGAGCLIFRSFAVHTATSAATDTTLYFKADGLSDAPEVGQLIMKAPASATGTGQSGKITAVEYDATNEKFEVTVDTALGSLSVGDVIVEANGTAASASAPTPLPTIAESARLYNCWNMLPMSIGIENSKRSFVVLPLVMSLTIELIWYLRCFFFLPRRYHFDSGSTMNYNANKLIFCSVLW